MELVTYRCEDGVATITMDDGKVNVMSVAMQDALNAAFDRATADGAVVVLTGRDGIFSAGFDLKVFEEGGPGLGEMLNGGFELAARVFSHPAPVVVACSGHAVAMGFFLLLSGDYLIGVDGPYRLVANEVSIGLSVPFVPMEIMRQRLTPAAFNRAVGLAEPFSPQQAIAAGSLDRVVAPGELLAVAHEVATAFSALDRAAHTATKLHARAPTLQAIRAALAAQED